MKRIILLLACFIMVFSITAFAEPAQEKDETIPPFDGYAFNMTREDVREKLGNPFEIEGNTETYYEVEYFGISGHLIFVYKNDQIDGVFWESPDLKNSDDEIQKIKDAVTAYFDERLGTEEKEEELEGETATVQRTAVTWRDDFNKIGGVYGTELSDKGTKIVIGFQKQFGKAENNSIADELATLTEDDIQKALDDLAAELESALADVGN